MKIKVIAGEGERLLFPYGLAWRHWCDGDIYYLIPINFFVRLWRWIHKWILSYRPSKQEFLEFIIFYEGKYVANDFLYEKLTNDGPDKLIEFMRSNDVDKNIVLSNMKYGLGNQPGNMWLCSHCDYKNPKSDKSK